MLQAARSVALTQLLRELEPGLAVEEKLAIGWPANEIAAQMIVRLGASLASLEPRHTPTSIPRNAAC